MKIERPIYMQQLIDSKGTVPCAVMLNDTQTVGV